MDPAPPHRVQLDQILKCLEKDPYNVSLLSSAALLAFDANDLSLCKELVDRLTSLSPTSDALQELQLLLPIAQKRFSRDAP